MGAIGAPRQENSVALPQLLLLVQAQLTFVCHGRYFSPPHEAIIFVWKVMAFPRLESDPCGRRLTGDHRFPQHQCDFASPLQTTSSHFTVP